FFFSSRRRHTRFSRDWSSDVCSSDLSGLNFIVTLAGPTIRMDSLMILQNVAVMKSQGKDISPAERAMIKKNYEIMASDLPSDKRSEERRVGKEWRSRWKT